MLAAPDSAVYVLSYRGEPASIRTRSLATDLGPKYARCASMNKGHIEVLAWRCNARRNCTDFGVLVVQGRKPLDPQPEPKGTGDHNWPQ